MFKQIKLITNLIPAQVWLRKNKQYLILYPKKVKCEDDAFGYYKMAYESFWKTISCHAQTLIKPCNEMMWLKINDIISDIFLLFSPWKHHSILSSIENTY